MPSKFQRLGAAEAHVPSRSGKRGHAAAASYPGATTDRRIAWHEYLSAITPDRVRVRGGQRGSTHAAATPSLCESVLCAQELLAVGWPVRRFMNSPEELANIHQRGDARLAIRAQARDAEYEAPIINWLHPTREGPLCTPTRVLYAVSTRLHPVLRRVQATLGAVDVAATLGAVDVAYCNTMVHMGLVLSFAAEETSAADLTAETSIMMFAGLNTIASVYAKVATPAQKDRLNVTLKQLLCSPRAVPLEKTLLAYVLRTVALAGTALLADIVLSLPVRARTPRAPYPSYRAGRLVGEPR